MPFRGTLSIDKIKKDLDFKPNFPIEKGYQIITIGIKNLIFKTLCVV